MADAGFRDIACCGNTFLADFGWKNIISASSPRLALTGSQVPPRCWWRELGKVMPCLTSGQSSALAQPSEPFRNAAECVQSGLRDSYAAPVAGRAVEMQPQAGNTHRQREDLSPNPVPWPSLACGLSFMGSAVYPKCFLTPEHTAWELGPGSLAHPTGSLSLACSLSCVWFSVLSLERKGSWIWTQRSQPSAHISLRVLWHLFSSIKECCALETIFLLNRRVLL